MILNNLIEISSYFSDKQRCIEYLTKMRWKDGVTCPFCDGKKVYELKGKTKGYKCPKCKKLFSAIKGTIFENSPLPLQKWFVAIYLMSSHKKGISSLQLARDIGVTQTTAWFMTQRIRYAFKNKTFDKMSGIIQADESYIGGKNKNRSWGKKVAQSQGRSLKDKTPVFGLVDNLGKVYTEVVSDTKAMTLGKVIDKMVKGGSIIVTDEWKAYKKLHRKYLHIVLNHDDEEFVRGAFHNNSIEGFWSLLKRGILGIYHNVSAKHLHRYCDEFSYRYNTRKISENEKFQKVVSRVNGRLKYKDLTA